MKRWQTNSRVVLLASLLSAMATTSQADSEIVNLARLSSTCVSASSVNGSRPPSNQFYGVLNLFDGGENWINNINYTNWLTDTQSRHWVKLSFKKPVTIHSVVVETTNDRKPTEYALELSQIGDRFTRIVGEYDSIPITGFKTSYQLPQPAKDIDEVTIVFPGFGMIQVSEIKVMGQAPEGTDLTPHAPLVRLNDRQAQGPHILDIQRVIRGENDESMIAIAESACPPREDVVKAIGAAHFKLAAVPTEENLWWYSSFAGVRIPYAITAGAIAYYEALVQEHRKKDWKSDIEPSSKFSYSASADFETNYSKDGKEFRDVYVVQMKLSFSAHFASLSAVAFSKERIVILDWKGTVLAIFGDGKTPVVVS